MKAEDTVYACAAENGHQSGLKARDFIAIEAPISFMDAHAMLSATKANAGVENELILHEETFKVLTALRYQYADAMIAESNK